VFRLVQGSGSALGMLVGGRVLPRDRRLEPERARALDLPGLVLLASAVSLLTESRLARRGGAPLIAPRVLCHPGPGLAVLWIMAVMAVNGGFLFALTLHVQGGLGFSAPRAGLTFVPIAVVFGAVGLTWRRWPAAWQRALTPLGFVITMPSVAGVGLAFEGGGHRGAVLYVVYVGVGAGLALAFSPSLTRAPATVRPEDAADASGLPATVTQLGQLLGVAVFGTLFLNRLESLGAPGAYTSAEALLACMFALAGTAAVGAVSGLVLRRR
jgi:hypothetical protein